MAKIMITGKREWVLEKGRKPVSARDGVIEVSSKVAEKYTKNYPKEFRLIEEKKPQVKNDVKKDD